MADLLTVSGLQAWYGESHVLHGVDLSVAEGEMICILGRNGMGKTTTLRTIMGILRKRTGQISFAGRDLMSMPLHKVAHAGLGFVPEERGIFATLSVQENLMLPPTVAQGGMSLDEIYDLFPNLLERRNSPGTKLSGGEQQMLAMARILRTGASILLLDEITEGLAPVIVDKLGEVLTELKSRGFTIVLVEQNFRFAAPLADRHLIMDHGHIVATVARDELEAKRAVFDEYLSV